MKTLELVTRYSDLSRQIKELEVLKGQIAGELKSLGNVETDEYLVTNNPRKGEVDFVKFLGSRGISLDECESFRKSPVQVLRVVVK